VSPSRVHVRTTEPRDIPGIIEVCSRVYPNNLPYGRDQLENHLEVFAEGQLSAVETKDGEERVVGMAASLIVLWEDYDFELAWREFTAAGYFTNHDPHGRTLYGAEVMVDPRTQGSGVGSLLYEARDELLRRLDLRRIRAGARLRGYHAYAGHMDAEEYVARVVLGEIRDPTLTFQLRRGFHVLAVVSGYLGNDPESLGWAALIEKLNPGLANEEEQARSRGRFRAAEHLEPEDAPAG
jgi:GNAT superfamily N-acetyltransferase